MGKGLGLRNLVKAAEERLMAEKAKEAAKAALKEEIATARKEVKDNSYCWTMKDVARFFEVHPKTVARWKKWWGLPFKKFGGSVRFRPGDVRRWDAQRRRS